MKKLKRYALIFKALKGGGPISALAFNCQKKTGRKGSVGEIKIEVFSEGEKGFLVTIFDTKSAEDA